MQQHLSQSKTMSNGTRVLCSIVATAVLQVFPTGRPFSWLKHTCYATTLSVRRLRKYPPCLMFSSSEAVVNIVFPCHGIYGCGRK